MGNPSAAEIVIFLLMAWFFHSQVISNNGIAHVEQMNPCLNFTTKDFKHLSHVSVN